LAGGHRGAHDGEMENSGRFVADCERCWLPGRPGDCLSSRETRCRRSTEHAQTLHAQQRLGEEPHVERVDLGGAEPKPSEVLSSSWEVVTSCSKVERSKAVAIATACAFSKRVIA
jgi:hypothetical protein